jgi:oxygen-independent coproporphyrinogen-3 oxidase
MERKKIEFSGREPIGSSTYPMPSEDINYKSHYERLQQRPLSNEKTSTLYIHIPFCDQICSFCGFNKFISTEERKVAYVQALLQEIAFYSQFPYIKELEITAVYLGGGTPNSLSSTQLDLILKAIHVSFNLTQDCEITCEGTPQNFTEDRIDILKANKVFRVSAGIQTFNQAIREEHLHMRNNEEELIGFIERIEKNFDNFNLDFIYNLPKQTFENFHHDLDVAFLRKATHLTVYPLVLLENTRFYSDYVKLKKNEIPSEEKEIAFFDILLERMKHTSFDTYSVRDWALPGKECKYIYSNAKCNQVLALGAGAHGYVAGITYRNERNLNRYGELISQKLIPVDRHKICTDEELMQRFMVMGLRLFKLNMLDFHKKFDCNWQDVFGEKVKDLVDNGYLTLNDNVINHTDKGHVWANNIRTYFEGQKGLSVGYTDSVGIDSSGKSHFKEISRIKASADIEAHE